MDENPHMQGYGSVECSQTLDSIRSALAPLRVEGGQVYAVRFQRDNKIDVQHVYSPSVQLQDNRNGLNAQGLFSIDSTPYNGRTELPMQEGDSQSRDRPSSCNCSHSNGKLPIEDKDQRGRSMLPRNEPKLVNAPYLGPIEFREEQVQPLKEMKSFRIDDTDKVMAFLSSALTRMQQLAIKKIAKAWIKGICPKKQSRFPYHQNTKSGHSYGRNDRSAVPEWWPDPDRDCRFIEPDHIKKDERMKLCIHLLRLRPTPTQLMDWNQNRCDPHPAHAAQGWTAFLEELAPVKILDGLTKEDKKKSEHRKDLMHEMYMCARMEEAFLAGDVDGSEEFTPAVEDEELLVSSTKRPRPLSEHSTVGSDSRASSLSADHVRAKKKARKACLLDEPPKMSNVGALEVSDSNSCLRKSQQTRDQVFSSFNVKYESNSAESLSSSVNDGFENASFDAGHGDASLRQYEARSMECGKTKEDNRVATPEQWRSYFAQWSDNPLPPTSSPSDHLSSGSLTYQDQKWQFPRQQDLRLSDHQQRTQYQQDAQVYDCHQIPEPTFNDLPFLPESVVSMPLGNSLLPHNFALAQEQVYQSSHSQYAPLHSCPPSSTVLRPMAMFPELQDPMEQGLSSFQFSDVSSGQPTEW